MTMVSSGQIALAGNLTNAGLNESVDIELGQTSTTTISMNATNVRTLAGIASGQISLSSFYGKSNGIGSFTAASGLGSQTFTSVAYGASIFVAVGPSGAIYSSSNGSTWTSRNANTTPSFQNVTFVNSMFVASGNLGYYAYSSNGTSWTIVQMNIGSGATASTNYNLGNCVYANGYYCMTGSNSSGNQVPYIYYCTGLTNATAWTAGFTGLSTTYLFGHNDGIPSLATNGSGGLTAIASSGSAPVTAVVYSTNSTSWSDVAPPNLTAEGQLTWSVVWDGTQFVGVGGGSGGYYSTSAAGQGTWATMASNSSLATNFILDTFMYVNSTYIALGENTINDNAAILSSSTLSGTFTSNSSGSAASSFQSALSVAYSGSIYVAVGISGYIGYT